MRIYIASPLYSSGNINDNLKFVYDVADQLILKGHIPYVAHLNHYWNIHSPHSEDYWLELDFKWIDVCDCVLRLGGYSVGAIKEVQYAVSKGIPVYFDIEALQQQ